MCLPLWTLLRYKGTPDRVSGAASRGRATMQLTRLKAPTMFLAVVALVVGVSSGAVAAKLITGADIKDGTVKSADIKNGTLVTKDLKKGGVSADRLKAGSVGNGKLAGN